VKLKKTIYTLNIDNYEPEIFELCMFYMKLYAYKIGAEIFIIQDRKISDKFAGLEKFQIYELGKEHKNDWNIFIDPDALIHPDFFDPTVMMTKDWTAAFGVSDFTPIRFRTDEYFLRDGRFYGKGNWFGICSDWCLDYFHPLDDISLEEAMSNCFPMNDEISSNKPMSGHNMVEDYIVSRNIARYGLKHTLVADLMTKYGKNIGYCHQMQTSVQGTQMLSSGPVFHVYLQSSEQKLVMMKKQIKAWQLKIMPESLMEELYPTNKGNKYPGIQGDPSLTPEYEKACQP
jgi:hypothetical protein